MFLPFCLPARFGRWPHRVQDETTLPHSRRGSQATATCAALHLMALGTLVAFAAATGAQELDREAEYRQNTAVLARYPDVPIALDPPALKPGRADFTSQAEMEAYLGALKARVPGVVLGSLGRSA